MRNNKRGLEAHRTHIEMIYRLGGGVIYLKHLRKLLELFEGANNPYKQNKILDDLEYEEIIKYHTTQDSFRIVYLTSKALKYITGKDNAKAIQNVQERANLSDFTVRHHINCIMELEQQGEALTYKQYIARRRGKGDSTIFKKEDGLKYLNLLGKLKLLEYQNIDLLNTSLETYWHSPQIIELIKYVANLKSRMERTKQHKLNSSSRARAVKDTEIKKNIVFSKSTNYLHKAKISNADFKTEKAAKIDIGIDFNSLFRKDIYITSIRKFLDPTTKHQKYMFQVSIYDTFDNLDNETMSKKIAETDNFLKKILYDAIVKIEYNVYTENPVSTSVLGYNVNVVSIQNNRFYRE